MDSRANNLNAVFSALAAVGTGPWELPSAYCGRRNQYRPATKHTSATAKKKTRRRVRNKIARESRRRNR